MSLETAAFALERHLEQLQPIGSRAEAVRHAAETIVTALLVMRFQRSFSTSGPFRRESFGPTPQLPAGPLWPDHAAAFIELGKLAGPIAALVPALEALQRLVIFEADCAESTDAHNNSRQYLQAAGYLDRAAADLASLVAPRVART